VPFKYAIKVTTEKVGVTDYYGDPVYTVEYHLAPKDFAETDKRGMKMLVSATGAPLTDWVPIKRPTGDITALKLKSKAPALPDFMGTQLAVGDYVVTYVKRYVDLQVCEVIGFVKQGKVRIMPVDNIEQTHGLLKFPTEIVQIPHSVLGDDPNGEWIPTEEEMF
jgi:hypothetical protein